MRCEINPTPPTLILILLETDHTANRVSGQQTETSRATASVQPQNLSRYPNDSQGSRHAQADPDEPRQGQAEADGPSRVRRPKSQTGHTTQTKPNGPDGPSRPDRIWPTQNQAHVPSCDNISVNENSGEFQASSKTNHKSLAARSQNSE